jgi:hypothetical protein
MQPDVHKKKQRLATSISQILIDVHFAFIILKKKKDFSKNKKYVNII